MGELIRATPGVVGGCARVGDRRVAVWMLVQDRRLGLSDEEIRHRYAPPLTPDELAAAWRYSDANADEVERSLRENE